MLNVILNLFINFYYFSWFSIFLQLKPNKTHPWSSPGVGSARQAYGRPSVEDLVAILFTTLYINVPQSSIVLQSLNMFSICKMVKLFWNSS